MVVRATLLLTAVLVFPGTPARAQDHLEPEPDVFTVYDWEWVYVGNLRANLLGDAKPEHQARMICCHSSKPEWAVTVVRRGEGEMFTQGTRDYFVEFAAAEKMIWEGGERAARVPVKRARVGLDRATAEAVSEVWHRMLLDVHARDPRAPQNGEDGVLYHFSRHARLIKGGPPEGSGAGKAWMGDEDLLRGKAGELAAIGTALKDYASAKPEDREALASRIRARAVRLRDQLGPPKKP